MGMKMKASAVQLPGITAMIFPSHGFALPSGDG